MDPRTIATRSAIKNAFVELSIESSINDISVSALCKKVGIPRQTFYYHYNNWQQLIEDILDDEVAQYTEILTSDKDAVEAVRLQVEAMEPRRDFHLKIDQAGYTSLLVRKMTRCCKDVFMDRWRNSNKDASETEIALNLEFAISGLYHILLNCDNEYNREEVIEFAAQSLRYQREFLKSRF